MSAREPDLLTAAKAMVLRLDSITSHEFSRGADRAEREALRAAVAKAEAGQ